MFGHYIGEMVLIEYLLSDQFRLLLVPVALFFACCYLWETYYLNKKDPNSKLSLPPGKMGLPIVGEMFNFLIWGVNFQRCRRRQYGPVYRTHLFGSPTIVVTGEENVKQILTGEGDLVQTKWPYTTRLILGTDGIVNGCPGTHQRIKKLVVRAFSPKCMQNYSASVQNVIQRHTEVMINTGNVHIAEACRQMVASTMMSVLLGIEQNDPDIQSYIHAADGIINSILCIPLDTPLSAFRKGKQAKKFIYDNLKPRLMRKFNASNDELFGCDLDEDISQSDFIDIIAKKCDSVLVNIIKLSRLTKDNEITLKNLQNLSLEFIFAGTQSLQCSSSSMLMHLSQDKKVFMRMREEVDRVCGRQHITFDMLDQLKFTTCVVNEVLRVTPPIPGAIRVAKRTFEMRGYQIPRNWQIVYSIRETHEIAGGEKPTTKPHVAFNPFYFDCNICKDRSSITKENEKQKNYKHFCRKTNGSYSFVPYGKGKRQCVGKNYADLVLKLFAAEIARSVDLELESKVKVVEIPMTKPAKSVVVKFLRRKYE